MPRLLLSGLLLLATLAVTSPLASAQTDWLQEFLNSSILSGTETTFIAYPNGTHYVAVNGSRGEGVISTGRGSYTLGTGSYVIAGDGEPYDCAQQPAECQQLLEEAADAPPANDPPQNDPPADTPPSNPPPSEPPTDTKVVFLPQFEVQKSGLVTYRVEGATRRGVWGLLLLDEWIASRKRTR